MKNSEISKRIKNLRLFLGNSLRKGKPVTQTFLARRLGVSRTQVSAWEAGRERPSADNLIRLAGLTPEPENLYFWHQAGVNPLNVERAVKAKMLKAQNKQALSETTLIRRLSIPALLERVKGNEQDAEGETKDFVPFSAWLIGDAASTVCIQATLGMAGAHISAGDRVLIDLTRRNLAELLNGFVAVASEDIYLSRFLKPEIVRLLPPAPLFTERDRRENELNRSRDPLVRAETDRRSDEQMNRILKELLPDVVFGTLRVEMSERAREIPKGVRENMPWHLVLDGGTFTIPLTPWSVDSLCDAALAFPAELKICILGTVIGWLRAPGSSAPLKAAPVEPAAVDE